MKMLCYFCLRPDKVRVKLIKKTVYTNEFTSRKPWFSCRETPRRLGISQFPNHPRLSRLMNTLNRRHRGRRHRVSIGKIETLLIFPIPPRQNMGRWGNYNVPDRLGFTDIWKLGELWKSYAKITEDRYHHLFNVENGECARRTSRIKDS